MVGGISPEPDGIKFNAAFHEREGSRLESNKTHITSGLSRRSCTKSTVSRRNREKKIPETRTGES